MRCWDPPSSPAAMARPEWGPDKRCRHGWPKPTRPATAAKHRYAQDSLHLLIQNVQAQPSGMDSTLQRTMQSCKLCGFNPPEQDAEMRVAHVCMHVCACACCVFYHKSPLHRCVILWHGFQALFRPSRWGSQSLGIETKPMYNGLEQKCGNTNVCTFWRNSADNSHG